MVGGGLFVDLEMPRLRYLIVDPTTEVLRQATSKKRQCNEQEAAGYMKVKYRAKKQPNENT